VRYEPPDEGYKSKEAQNAWHLAAMGVLPGDTYRQRELKVPGAWRYVSPT